MSRSITQDMAYRQSLMKYAEKYGVSRASRKYNKSRSYIYFWKARWDGTVGSGLPVQTPPQPSKPTHRGGTEADPGYARRNPDLGMVELWHRLRQRGYTRRPESLFRVMRKLGLFPPSKKKNTYKPKPYEQMTYPGQRVQVDVKVVLPLDASQTRSCVCSSIPLLTSLLACASWLPTPNTPPTPLLIFSKS